MSELVETVGGENAGPREVPAELSEIVCDYYSEEVVGDEVATDVLAYLSNVYSDHGYYDTGRWDTGKLAHRPRRFIREYQPYKGDLQEYSDSDFQLPARGSLTSGYGYRPRFKRFHHGIDIALHTGDTVKCSLPGIVVKTGYEKGGYGRYVVVAHSGGIDTLYGHLSCSLVNPGQKLAAGAAVGLGGTTGNSTGPHLHFETRYRGVAIDPVSWFSLDL